MCFMSHFQMEHDLTTLESMAANFILKIHFVHFAYFAAQTIFKAKMQNVM